MADLIVLSELLYSNQFSPESGMASHPGAENPLRIRIRKRVREIFCCHAYVKKKTGVVSLPRVEFSRKKGGHNKTRLWDADY